MGNNYHALAVFLCNLDDNDTWLKFPELGIFNIPSYNL